MSYSRRSRHFHPPPPPPYRLRSRSVSSSRSLLRSQSRSRDSSDAENPGNNLYVTGLSARVTERNLEKHFSTEGTVEDVNLVVDPWSRESRGFGFVTMSTVREANRCIKYLNNSVLEGRVITIEKARRRRGRKPAPGRYLGLRNIRERRRSSSYSPDYKSYSHSPQYSSESYSRSPQYSSEGYRSRSRSYSPYYSRRRRSFSPRYHRRRPYSAYYRRDRSYSRSHSPYYRRDRSYSRSHSPYYRRERSYSRSLSPYSRSPVSRHDRSYSPYYRNYSPYHRYRRSLRYRSLSTSISPRVRRYSLRNYSPRRSGSYSRSVSPRHSLRSYSRSVSPLPRRRRSRRSYSSGEPPSPPSPSNSSTSSTLIHSHGISPPRKGSKRSGT